jgi:alanine-glyoxylate transaminase / serine-glyoxylate transaminase / serine-pyruvate transaminase
MDRWGANVVLGASQKGLMTPPGVGLVAVDARAAAVAARNPAPRYYWDWRLRSSPLSYRKFCGTPPQTLIAGLAAAFALIELEGEDAVLARHRRLAGAVQAAVAAWSAGGGVDFFCPEPAARSVSVTAIRTAEGVDPDAIRRVAREDFDVSIAGGLGPLAGRVFRIGHLGDVNVPMVLGALAGVQAAFERLGVPYGRDGVAAAIDAIARTASGTSAGPR